MTQNKPSTTLVIAEVYQLTLTNHKTLTSPSAFFEFLDDMEPKELDPKDPKFDSRKKNAPGFVAAQYADRRSRRTENLQPESRTNVLCFDVDNVKPAQLAAGEKPNLSPLGSKETRDFLRKLSKFSCFVHTTASSTPELPRFRVLVALDRSVRHADYDAAGWKRLLMQAWAYMDLGAEMDTKAVDKVRFLLYPQVRTDGEYACGYFKGKPLPLWDLVKIQVAEAPKKKKKPEPDAERKAKAVNMAVAKSRALKKVGEGGRNDAFLKAGVAVAARHGDVLSPEELIDQLDGAMKKLAESQAEREEFETALLNGYRYGLEEWQKKEAWEQQLEVSAEGGYLSSDCNVALFVQNHPELKGLLAFNERALRLALTRCPPWREEDDPRAMKFDDQKYVASLLLFLKEQGMSSPRRRPVLDALANEVKEHSFDPVKEAMKELEWDGVERLGTWLSNHTNDVENQELANECLKRWMVSAVKRTFEPGCFADTVLTFVGPQGVGKTKFLSLLAGDFGCVGLTRTPVDKDDVMKPHGSLFADFGEYAASTKRAHADRLKQYVTEGVDDIRLPYARQKESYPRRFVFCATTNRHTFLADATGNRRFWIVDVKKLDFVQARLDREQLWAEAVTLYASGYPSFFDEERKEDSGWLAQLEQAQRQHTRAPRFAAELRMKAADIAKRGQWPSYTFGPGVSEGEELRACLSKEGEFNGLTMDVALKLLNAFKKDSERDEMERAFEWLVWSPRTIGGFTVYCPPSSSDGA